MSNESLPDRCVNCPHFKIDRSLEYYNHPICGKNGWSINFSTFEGWDRMVWCPLLEKENEE